MIKSYITIMVLLFLSGCTVTVKHEIDTTLLTPTVKEVVKECKSNALNKLHAMEKIDIEKYKKNNDVDGLLKAAFNRLSLRRDYVDIVVEDIKRCKE